MRTSIMLYSSSILHIKHVPGAFMSAYQRVQKKGENKKTERNSNEAEEDKAIETA